MSRALLILIAALLACLFVSLFCESFIALRYAYYYDILITIGINVILATSLNLVNGYTGQFSLGHAGFMAVGAYASGSWSNHLDPYILGLLGGANNPVATNTAFLISMLFAGILAAITGFAVGVPSLRLKGDYLAIVTLGFDTQYRFSRCVSRSQRDRKLYQSVLDLWLCCRLCLHGPEPRPLHFWTRIYYSARR
jgi:branched-chain amino acid transport system permease protein